MIEDKPYNIRRALVIVILILMFLTVGMLFVAFQTKTITINYLGKEQTVKTLASNVNSLLDQHNIFVDDTFDVSPSIESGLTNHMQINIYKNSELVKFNLEEDFSIDAPIIEKIEEIEENIEHETETRSNASVTRGNKTVVQQGEDGQKVTVYKITYKDGIEVARKQIDESILKEPTSEVIEVGTKLVANNSVGQVSSRYLEKQREFNKIGGRPTSYSRTVDVKYTVYCLCQRCTGKTPSSPSYGNTASGLKIIPNAGMKVIAVDTSVIPLGSWVYVESLTPGVPDYGYAYAGDTGSAIKGNKIDLYIDTHTTSGPYGGRGNMRVYVIE